MSELLTTYLVPIFGTVVLTTLFLRGLARLLITALWAGFYLLIGVPPKTIRRFAVDAGRHHQAGRRR